MLHYNVAELRFKKKMHFYFLFVYLLILVSNLKRVHLSEVNVLIAIWWLLYYLYTQYNLFWRKTKVKATALVVCVHYTQYNLFWRKKSEG